MPQNNTRKLGASRLGIVVLTAASKSAFVGFCICRTTCLLLYQRLNHNTFVLLFIVNLDYYLLVLLASSHYVAFCTSSIVIMLKVST